jgi:hypothetical protein
MFDGGRPDSALANNKNATTAKHNQDRRRQDKAAKSATQDEMDNNSRQCGHGRCEHQSGASCAPAQGDDAWEFRKFPRPLAGTRVYCCLSTCWMFYLVARGLFYERLSHSLAAISRPLFGLDGHCLLVGRIETHPAFGQKSRTIIAIYHLFWRLQQAMPRQGLKLTMFNFMMLSEASSERFRQRLRRGHWQERPSQKNGKQRRNSEAHLNPRADRNDHGDDDGERAAGPSGRLCLADRFARHSMCYQVHSGDRVHFKLRPNRTRAARSLLAEEVARSMVVQTLIFGPLLAVVLAHVLLIALSDRHYLTAYPGCDAELERRLASSELPFLSMTISGHHLVSCIFDLAANVIVWFDCGVSILHGTAFCRLFNYDLLLYWSSLRAKLADLLERTRQREPLHWARAAERLPAARRPPGMWAGELGPAVERRRSSSHGRDAASRHANHHDQLELDIRELQSELFDFFHEVGRVDVLVSDVLTYAILVWLAGCAVVSYNVVITDRRSSVPMAILFLLAVGLVVIAAITHFILRLRRSCLDGHKALCSLIASHQSCEKQRILSVLDFFDKINRTTFTLAHCYPYKPTTFITILGYSVSCFLMSLTLFGNRQSADDAERYWPPPLVEANASFVERFLRSLEIY